jgi:outer membrane lipoprotein
MTTSRRLAFTLLVPTLWLLSACATTSDCVKAVGPSGLTPAKVVALGQGQGSVVTWGGVIASTRNLERDTEIETIGYALDRCGKPVKGDDPQGRFIVRQPGFLEPADYRAGRRITATGRIGPLQEGRVGDAPYTFPVLENPVVRLWPDSQASSGSAWTPRLRPYLGIGFGSGGYSGIGGGIGLGF